MSAVLLPRPAGLDGLVAAGRPERLGTVSSVIGLGITVTGIEASMGEVVHVGPERARAEVVAVSGAGLTLMPIDRIDSLRVGAVVRPTGHRMTVPTGFGLLGRVLDATGRPIDGRGPLEIERRVPVDAEAPSALERARIDTPLALGVRALDTLTAVGRGQRIGLFAGSGVGKSSLLSMIARGTDAQVNVIALIGERGREVREFLEDDLGEEGLARSVVIVSTADQPALTRARAAFTATRIAESFRDAGAHAVLMMDSLTRVAMAQREIGLAAGEPPATRGYPPSVFGLLARLLERAGTGPVGSVTGIYTVLVDGDDHNEPIADTARSILDGHVVLDRKLATAGHFPSIDVLGSVSRSANRVTSREQQAAARALRSALAARRSVQDLIDVGAYAQGSNPKVDAAVAFAADIDGFLQQDMEDVTPLDEAWLRLASLVGGDGRLMAVFSLASLLRVRRLREERASWEMSRARSRASELAQDRHQLLDQLSDHGHDASGVRGIAAISAARASTSTMLADLEALTTTHQRVLEEAEEAHAAARRDVRTVEKLEEKHDETTRREALRAEQAVLDELAGRVRSRLVPPGSADA